MADQYNSNTGSPTVPNSTLAIVTLVAGILGLTFFPLLGSIVAVITGPMAKKEIAQSQGSLSGESMAQIGMILGWIGLALGLIGCCIAMVALALPFALLMFGLGSGDFGLVLPALLAF
jgi:hypothetical protein